MASNEAEFRTALLEAADDRRGHDQNALTTVAMSAVFQDGELKGFDSKWLYDHFTVTEFDRLLNNLKVRLELGSKEHTKVCHGNNRWELDPINNRWKCRIWPGSVCCD
jgi:hypothetical protein